MEVDHNDQPHPSLSYFDCTPSAFPWRDNRPVEIEARRAQMADQLLFDTLLTTGNIRSGESLYPPTDREGLENLLWAIDDSTFDSLKKECLVYYLLKWHFDSRERAFAEEKCLAPQFTALVDAYWHLDSGINVEHAVSILADPRLDQDYASKIIHALSLSEGSSRLVLRYVRTAKPTLNQPDDLDTYTVALAENSLHDAWRFQRTFGESGETRQRLIYKILDWCISPKPRPRALSQLMNFSLTPYEQTTLFTYALTPPAHTPAASVPIIHDFVFVYLIQTGQQTEAIRMDRKFAASALSTRAEVRKAVEERQRTIDDLKGTLTRVELAVLKAELEASSLPPRPKPAQPITPSGSNDMQVDDAKKVEAAPTAAEEAKSAPPNGIISASSSKSKPKPHDYASLFPTTSITQPASSSAEHLSGTSLSLSAKGALGGGSSSGSGSSNTSITAPLIPLSSQPARQSPYSQVLQNRKPLSRVSGGHYVPPPPVSAAAVGQSHNNQSQGQGGNHVALRMSANAVRNAFYTPPVSSGPAHRLSTGTNGSAFEKPISASASGQNNRQIGQDEPANTLGAEEVAEQGDDDTAMETDDEIVTRSSRRKTVPVAEPELAYSLFSNHQPSQLTQKRHEEGKNRSIGSRKISGRISSGSSKRKTEDDASRVSRGGMSISSGKKVPPGAFDVDGDDVEDEHDHDHDHDAEAQSLSIRHTSRHHQHHQQDNSEPEQEQISSHTRAGSKKRSGSSPPSSPPPAKQKKPPTSSRTRSIKKAASKERPSERAMVKVKPSTSKGKGKSAVKQESSTRSIPGRFGDDDDGDDEDDDNDVHAQRQAKDEDEDEEDDKISSLPARSVLSPTRSTTGRRKGRSSAAASTSAEGPVRRSSRLSSVPVATTANVDGGESDMGMGPSTRKTPRKSTKGKKGVKA